MPLKDLTNTPPRQQQPHAKQSHPANKVVWSTIRPKLMTPAAEMVRRMEPPSTAGLRAKPPPPLSDGASSLGDVEISSPDEAVMSQGRTSKSLSFEGSGEGEEASPCSDAPNPVPKPSGAPKSAADNANRSIMRGISTPGIDARTQILVLEARLKDEQRRARESDARAESLRRQNAALLQQRSQALERHKEDHPVFGELLADMGFKRIYVASARTLVHSVPIWRARAPPLAPHLARPRTPSLAEPAENMRAPPPTPDPDPGRSSDRATRGVSRRSCGRSAPRRASWARSCASRCAASRR